MSELDDKPDGYYWAKTRKMGVWRMLRKSTERQTWGNPWKDVEANMRVSWEMIDDRYSELVKVNHP